MNYVIQESLLPIKKLINFLTFIELVSGCRFKTSVAYRLQLDLQQIYSNKFQPTRR